MWASGVSVTAPAVPSLWAKCRAERRRNARTGRATVSTERSAGKPFCHGSALNLERHDHLRPRQRAGQALLGHRVEDHPLPSRTRARRRANREPPHVLEGGQGGAVQGGGEGVRG